MKDVLTYKGYIGSVHYGAEDDVFHGRIEGIRDLILFEGRAVDELKRAFHNAVDDYLEFCKQVNKKPEKPYRGSFNIRISPEIHRQLAIKATMTGVSLNLLIQKVLEKAVAEETKNLPKNVYK